MTPVSLFAAVALMISPPQSHGAAPVVRVAQGVLAGTANGAVESYKGVPYATPPVGALRWRMPQPPESWDGERLATDYGTICIQPPSNGDPGVGPCR
jgi:para-nitrobenzyl esterase